MTYAGKSVEDLIKCARRELKMRERVYPRRLREETMDVQQAEHETACMLGIIEFLEKHGKPAQVSMFEDGK